MKSIKTMMFVCACLSAVFMTGCVDPANAQEPDPTPTPEPAKTVFLEAPIEIIEGSHYAVNSVVRNHIEAIQISASFNAADNASSCGLVLRGNTNTSAGNVINDESSSSSGEYPTNEDCFTRRQAWVNARFDINDDWVHGMSSATTYRYARKSAVIGFGIQYSLSRDECTIFLHTLYHRYGYLLTIDSSSEECLGDARAWIEAEFNANVISE